MLRPNACSRNARLSPEARAQSPAIYKALCWAQEAVSSGSGTDPARLREHVAKAIEEAGGKIDYIEVGGDQGLCLGSLSARSAILTLSLTIYMCVHVCMCACVCVSVQQTVLISPAIC